ncbi:WAT1-related protein At1g43650 [Beta vulgaris subsp. vulgaris]|uniref:WAT1-related protein At1g43650 n=1 Tax=Beta vulgaris subsp. vulgaris TaxID=3555 RepID=UPI0020373290|nr:WAT1-related protein At1g43650 [Beta vulgaris subsp. vulgaris]
MECRKLLKGSGPLVGMIMVQVISTGLQILSRVILTQGTFIFALMAYRHLLAALCIAPFAFFLERGNGTKLTLMVGVWVFLSSLSGITMGMGMFYYGLRDTTATYATNFLNLIPIVTFMFSIITRIEKLNLRTTKGKVRVAGTILCLAGALIISLYAGSVVISGSHHAHLPTLMIAKIVKPDWTRGTIILVASVLSYATWFIVQVKLLNAFPSKYWATMLTCISASIQTAVVGLCLDRRKTSWQLRWNLQLITIVYSGVLASAASFYLISWAVASRGPTYPAMFNPLSLIFVAIIEVLLLGEDLRTGSLLGMLAIIVGLYFFLWGSRKEKKIESPLPKSVKGEIQVMKSYEREGSQLSATVVPTTSPVSHSSDEQHDGL